MGGGGGGAETLSMKTDDTNEQMSPTQTLANVNGKLASANKDNRTDGKQKHTNTTRV